jgi:N4-(beta-N-acetylglucosaminyl)-L-asparaginase
MLTTWPFGLPACRVGYRRLLSGDSALDAVEAAANVTEDDPTVASVGTGGLPNADGVVELDAAIMDGRTHALGAVAALTDTARPISVARKVMESTPHTMLAGGNAVQFARGNGFARAELLTDDARRRWEEWRAAQRGPDVAHFEPRQASSRRSVPDDHDTIGLCALDTKGDLAAGCTTSGMAWKIPGRVGDSPIVGAGLYVDNEVGAAAATGHGDEMVKALICYRAVILMEQGRTPDEAVAEALRYLLRKRPPELYGHYGAAIIALRRDGQYAAGGTLSGFHNPDRLWTWAAAGPGEPELREGPYIILTSIVPSLGQPASP